LWSQSVGKNAREPEKEIFERCKLATGGTGPPPLRRVKGASCGKKMSGERGGKDPEYGLLSPAKKTKGQIFEKQ